MQRRLHVRVRAQLLRVRLGDGLARRYRRRRGAIVAARAVLVRWRVGARRRRHDRRRAAARRVWQLSVEWVKVISLVKNM